MKKKLFAACLAGVLLLAGCGGKAALNSTGGVADMAPSGSIMADEFSDSAMTTAPEAPSEEGWNTPGAAESESSVYQNTRAKLIRRAELSIETEQFDQSDQNLKALVSGCGGYFEQSSIYGGGYRDAYARRNGEYIIRVPAEKYSAFLSSAGELGYVTSSTESTEDVGEQYYDIEARLKTQRTKQERLLALLEKAESMEDIIALESALSDVEFQIEMYSSDLNRYDALISYATFRVYLNEVRQINQEVGETASLGARMAAGFASGFRDLIRSVQELLVWLSYNLFALVLLAAAAAAVIFVGRRTLKRQRGHAAKKKEKQEKPGEPPQ